MNINDYCNDALNTISSWVVEHKRSTIYRARFSEYKSFSDFESACKSESKSGSKYGSFIKNVYLPMLPKIADAVACRYAEYGFTICDMHGLNEIGFGDCDDDCDVRDATAEEIADYVGAEDATEEDFQCWVEDYMYPHFVKMYPTLLGLIAEAEQVLLDAETAIGDGDEEKFIATIAYANHIKHCGGDLLSDYMGDKDTVDRVSQEGIGNVFDLSELCLDEICIIGYDDILDSM